MGKLFIDYYSSSFLKMETPEYNKASASLFAAIPQGDSALDAIKALCERVDVKTAHSHRNYSALTLAILYKQSKTVSFLLRRGADANQPDLDERVPIDMGKRIQQGGDCESIREIIIELENTLPRRSIGNRR